jgi:hypothetical protein
VKIIVHVENGVHVEVVPSEGQEFIAVGEVVGLLEMAKAIALVQWQAALNQQKEGVEDVEDHETSRN